MERLICALLGQKGPVAQAFALVMVASCKHNDQNNRWRYQSSTGTFSRTPTSLLACRSDLNLQLALDAVNAPALISLPSAFNVSLADLDANIVSTHSPSTCPTSYPAQQRVCCYRSAIGTRRSTLSSHTSHIAPNSQSYPAA